MKRITLPAVSMPVMFLIGGVCITTLLAVSEAADLPELDSRSMSRAPDNRNSVYDLDGLLQQGVERNARVTAGRASADAAGKLRESAWQEYLPSPGVQVDRESDGRDTTVLSLQQPLWTGGRIDASIDAATENAKSAGTAISEEQYQISMSIINNYELYIRTEGRMKVLNQFMDRLNIYKTRMTNRVESGASPANDMELLDARIATTVAQLELAKTENVNAITQLSQLTNTELSHDSIAITTRKSSLPELTDVITRSKKYNPTLIRLQHDIDAAKANVRVQRSAIMPKISVVLKHSMYQGGNTPSDDTSVGLQMQLQPGAGISSYTNTQAAQAEVQALQWKKEATEQELLAEVKNNYETLSSSSRRLQATKRNAVAAENVLASYERLFISGKRGWLDVMNAARDLSDADLAVADNVAEQLGSEYRMDLFSAKYQWMESIK